MPLVKKREINKYATGNINGSITNSTVLNIRNLTFAPKYVILTTSSNMNGIHFRRTSSPLGSTALNEMINYGYYSGALGYGSHARPTFYTDGFAYLSGTGITSEFGITWEAFG